MSYWLDQRRRGWIARDRLWASRLHRAAALPSVVPVLQAASILGDGWLWYAILAAVPFVGGPTGWVCAQQMFAVGALNLLVYRLLKRRIGRARPFVNCPDIRACARALDQFSFPSGHTLHAVSFAILLSSHYPGFTALLWGFAALVAISRIVLGLHYPSDVVVGALIGGLTAGAVLLLS